MLKIDPKNGHLNFLYASLFHTFYQAHNYSETLSYYDKALEYGYNECKVRQARGNLYYILGKFDDARTDLELASSICTLDTISREHLQNVLVGREKEKMPSPVVVSVVPKCGTMLLKNILSSVIGDELVVPMNKYVGTGDYMRSLRRLDKVIYFGHLEYSNELSEKLSSVPKIILIRDPRDQIVSMAHHLDRAIWELSKYEDLWKNTDWDEKLTATIFGMSVPPLNNFPPSLSDLFMNYGIKWLAEKNSRRIMVLRYEDIVGSKYGGSDERCFKAIKSLMYFLGINTTDDQTLKQRIVEGSNPEKSTTFRSANIGSWRRELKPTHVSQIKSVSPGLVSVLGYEPNEDWGLSTRPLIRSELEISRDHLRTFINNIDRRKLTWQNSEMFCQELELQSKASSIIVNEWIANIFIKNNQIEDALHMLRRLLVSRPHDPRWNYFFALYSYIVGGDKLEALNHYNTSLEYGYDEFWVRYNRGCLYKTIGDLGKACEDLEISVRLDPSFKVAFKLLKECQAEKFLSEKRYEEAIIQLEDLLGISPEDAHANYLYAICLHTTKQDPERALRHYNIALEKGFDEFWVKYNRGNLLFSVGSFRLAKDDLLFVSQREDEGSFTHTRELLKKIEDMSQT